MTPAYALVAGSAMSSLQVSVYDHDQGRLVFEAHLDRFPVQIGRDPAAEVPLPYPFVSSRQAEVRGERGRLVLHDLGARNRLAVDGRRVPAEGLPLAPRLVARLGPLELRLELATPRPFALPDRASAAGALDPRPIPPTLLPPAPAPDLPLASVAAWLPLPVADERAALRLSARAADLLRLFAAFVLELAHLQAAQLRDLGHAPGVHPLVSACDGPDDLLRLLFGEGDHDRALADLFADLSAHPRALASGALAAAREVLAALDPAELGRAEGRAWPSRAAALWRHYQACHQALVGADLSPAFRDILARSYAAALARRPHAP